MALFRRTDLGNHGELSSPKERAAAQIIRQRGSSSGGTAAWGNITGVIENQDDLKELTDNLEALALFEGQ